MLSLLRPLGRWLHRLWARRPRPILARRLRRDALVATTLLPHWLQHLSAQQETTQALLRELITHITGQPPETTLTPSPSRSPVGVPTVLTDPTVPAPTRQPVRKRTAQDVIYQTRESMLADQHRDRVAAQQRRQEGQRIVDRDPVLPPRAAAAPPIV